MVILPGLSQLRITLRLPAVALNPVGAAMATAPSNGWTSSVSDPGPCNGPAMARTWKE